MYDTHNVKELPLLATLAKNVRIRQEAKLPTLETVQRETTLAILLAHADLEPYPLTRERVASLLSGETLWPGKRGNGISLQTTTTLDELIALGVVSFYNNHCTLNLSSKPDGAHINNQELVRTVTQLHHLFHSDEYLNPHFAIDIDEAEKIISERGIGCDLTQFSELEISDKRFIIHLPYRNRYELLNDYLVAELFSGDSEDENDITFDMPRWLLIAQTFPEKFLAQIDLARLSDARRHRLLDDAVKVIENDRQLDVSVRTLTAEWWCKNSYSVLNTDGTSMADRSAEGDFVTHLERQTDEHFFSPLEYVLTATESGWFDLGFNALSRYFFLPEHIITGDIYVDDHSFVSRGRADKLFALAESRPELKYILLYGLIDKNPDYFYYLLRRRDTSCLSLYYYKKLLIRVLDGHHPKQSPEILIHLFSELSEEFIRRYFTQHYDVQPDKREFALLLETLSDFQLPSTWHGEPTIDQILLDIFIEKLNANHLSKIDTLLFSFEKETSSINISNKLYLLFKILEKHQDHPCNGSQDDAIAIEECIGRWVKYGLSPEALVSHEQLRANNFIEQLSWWRLSERFFESLKLFVGSQSNFLKGHEKHKLTKYDYLNTRRSQLLIMISLITIKHDKSLINTIQQECVYIMRRCAEEDEHSLRYLISGFSSDGYSVWHPFLSTLEQSTGEVFNSVIRLLEEHFDLEYVFSLLHHTRSETRKKKVNALIHKRYLDNSSTLSQAGLDEISEAINYACMNNYISYASKLITRAKKILDRHKTNGYFIQQKKELWESIEYKVDILKVCNDQELTSAEKIVQFENLRPRKINSTYRKDCENFYRNCFAHLFINDDPERAFRIFDDLHKQTGSVFYAGNRFLAKYNLLVTNENDPLVYKSALDEWANSCEGEQLSTIEDTFIHVWMACLVKLNKHEELTKLWNKLLPSQKYVSEITVVYVTNLKVQQKLSEAMDIIEDYSIFHGTESQDDRLSNLRGAIQTMMIEGGDPRIVANVTHMVVNRPKDLTELTKSYNSIFSLPLLDIAGIIHPGTKSVDDYLNKHIRIVIKELLTRKIQLNNRSDKNRTLVIEDDINRWFVSLFNHLVQYAGMTCHEQKTSGVSPSGKNPGEVDFLFYERCTNQKLAIGEAFILTSVDTRAINNHIDKIAGYDQEELDTVIFIAWCSSLRFEEMAENYRHINQQREYKGFTSTGVLTFAEKPGSKLIVLKEIRLRNQKPITIYHYLVNLTV